MTINYVLQVLGNIENAKRANRLNARNIILENNTLFPFLLKIAFETQNKTAIKAAWVLELVCEQQLELLIPHLNSFLENIKYLKHESAIRPASKICMFLGEACTSKINNSIKKN